MRSRFIFLSLVVLFLLFPEISPALTSAFGPAYNGKSHHYVGSRIGLFCNGNPIGYVDPTGRIATPFLQNAGAQAANLSYSAADTIVNFVPGSISALSSGMGWTMQQLGMPYGHLYQQADAINTVLSPYARNGSYDPNSLVATAVAAGSVIIAPGSAPTKIASKGVQTVAQSGVKPLFGRPASAVADVAKRVPLPAGKIADHHIFPRQFERFFETKGINIDDFTVTLGTPSSHLRGIHGSGLGNMPGGWNQRWAEFIKSNPNASQVDLYKFGGSLMDEFNINHIPIHPYKIRQ